MSPRVQDFLSVDPGVKYFAWCLVVDGKLHSCGLDADNRNLAQRFPGIDTCIVEDQRIHRGQESKKGTIVELAQSAGEVVGQFYNRIYFWNTVPKAIFQARAEAALQPEELRIVKVHKKSDLKHIWDAIGFAMKYLGRI